MAINGTDGTETGIGSILAWQLSLCEDGTPSMGMCRQHSDSSLTQTRSGTNPDGSNVKINECYGAFGYFAGGPFFAGEKMPKGEDKHRIGATKEGKAIYSGHLQTNTLFHMPNELRHVPPFPDDPTLGDGPLQFEEEAVKWPAMKDIGFLQKVHFAFDPNQQYIHPAYGKQKGVWLWYTKTPSGGSSGDDDDTTKKDDDDDEGGGGGEEEKKKRRSVTTPRDDVHPDPDPVDPVPPEPVGGEHPDGVTTKGSGGTKKKESLIGTGGQLINVDGRYYYTKDFVVTETDELGYPIDSDGGKAGSGGSGGSTGGGGGVTIGTSGTTDVYYWDDGTVVGQDDINDFKKFHGIGETETKPQEKGGSGTGSGDGAGNGYLATPFQTSCGDVKAKGGPNSAIGSSSGGASPAIKDYRSRISDNSMRTWMARAPITGIQTAFYGYSQNWRDPVYTQRPRSEGGDGKYRSGTADGGWFIRQPESDVLDVREQNATGIDPIWIHTNSSTTVWGMLPEVRFFQGYPDMSTGGIKKGYSSYIDYATNKVKHSVKEFAGTETNFMDYPGASTDPLNVKVDLQADQNIKFKSGTANNGIFDHANSADRTYTYPNASGTVALTSDIPSGAGLWTLATDVVKPTTSSHKVAVNDNVLNHAVTDTNTGYKINADVFSIETGGTQAATFDSAETLTVTNKIAWKDDTSFTATLNHANTANRNITFPDNSITVASATGLSGGQTIYGGTGSSEDLTLIASSNATDGNIIFGSGSELILYTDGGASPFGVGTLYLKGDLHWESGTAGFDGQLIHNNTADRDYTFPDEAGQVKLKKDKIAWFWSGGQINNAYSAYPIHQATVSAGRPACVSGICPDDFSSLTELNLVIIPQATDATVSVARTSEYGASGEDHAANTSTTTTTLNLTAGRLTEVSISALYGSLAAQDYIGLEVVDNDTVTVVNVLGIKMVYTSTN